MWKECDRKVLRLLGEELDINYVVVERVPRVKAHITNKKNNKELSPRALVCSLLSFVDKAKTLKNRHLLKGTSHYPNANFSKETLAYRKDLWEKVRALKTEGTVAYLNYKSIVFRKRNDSHI